MEAFVTCVSASNTSLQIMDQETLEYELEIVDKGNLRC
jgi:hypothetical protein